MMTRQTRPTLPSLDARDIALLEDGHHPDPFAVLGRHGEGEACVVRAFLPGAAYVELVTGEGEERRSAAMLGRGGGLFEAPCPGAARYRLRAAWPGGITEAADPYSFGLLLSEDDVYLFAEGRHFDLSTRLGANPCSFDGVEGTLFAVWAPNAANVAVTGDFNGWDPRRHPMRRRLGPGVWELFIPGVPAGAIYKYAIVTAQGERLPWKADPLARATELPPRTGSVVAEPPTFAWTDEAWLARRQAAHPMAEPMAIYEVHVGAWLRTEWGGMGSWDEAT